MALETKMDRLIEDVAKVADMLFHLEEAGVVRRIDALEICDKQHEKAIDEVTRKQDTLIAETAGALRVLRWGMLILVAVSTAILMLNNGATLLHNIVYFH